MKNDTIEALNYTTEAIEHLRFMERGLLNTSPYSAYVLRQVIDMLHNSVKFILPNCCEIIEPDEYRQSHLDLARLPYPITTFEIPWNKANDDPDIAGVKSSRSSKRIALCWESKDDFEPIPGCNQVLKMYPGGGVFILPIPWSDKIKMWNISAGGVFFPYDNNISKKDDEKALPATKIANEALRIAGFVKQNAAHFLAEPFISCTDLTQELIEKFGSREKLFAHIIIDTRDELQAFIQACSVLNCENVQTVTLQRKHGSKFINGRKVEQNKKGKLPAYTYEVLQINEEKTNYISANSSKKGGSKRMHLRRGHIRRLNGKLLWIRPSMINADSNLGTIEKDYSLSIKNKHSI
uniref:hypothetical protein n=1 Tax=Serratia marcescens TaxID=615 RepID=UPI001F4C260F|nr:hypothetical protein [Serratia marcescens]ULG13097.1 hypothetical protein 1573p1_00036 [Serratia marcescens]